MLRNCVRVAQQTLTLFVWVRILVGQPPVPSPFDSSEGILNGMWLSLVERCVRDAEVASSNLVATTKKTPSHMCEGVFLSPHCSNL